jgi:hypothetical protein
VVPTEQHQRERRRLKTHIAFSLWWNGAPHESQAHSFLLLVGLVVRVHVDFDPNGGNRPRRKRDGSERNDLRAERLSPRARQGSQVRDRRARRRSAGRTRRMFFHREECLLTGIALGGSLPGEARAAASGSSTVGMLLRQRGKSCKTGSRDGPTLLTLR